jgi:hypothetical protein
MKRLLIALLLLGLVAAGCDKSSQTDDESATARPTSPSAPEEAPEVPTESEAKSLDDVVDNELVADGIPPNLPLQWHAPPRFPKPLPRTRHISFDDRPVKGASA